MPPQQAKGKKVDHLADVYALGVIFYEMLSGKQLITGKNISDVLYKVIHQEPDSLRWRTYQSKSSKYMVKEYINGGKSIVLTALIGILLLVFVWFFAKNYYKKNVYSLVIVLVFFFHFL